MTFEATFFGPGNRLRWEAILAGSLPGDVRERLGPFVDDLRQDRDVLFLPRVHENGRVQWYVLCSSTRVARIARDEVRAFLGPSYSDFEGRPSQWDATDPIEAAVITKYGNNALKFDVPQRDLIDAARERLLLLIHLRRGRPTRPTYAPRAAGRVLRDFEYALLAHDDARAFACIGELRTAGQLSAINLLFLEVRRLAASGNWSSILALAELDALLVMRRPRRVTEALICAVYVSMLRRFEDERHALEAIKCFRSEVFPRFHDLYRTSAGLTGYEVDASFLIATAASSDPHELPQSILGKYDHGSDARSYLESVAELIQQPLPRQADVIAEARAAFAATDIDRAYQLTLELPQSFERCALLLRCARDMGTLSATQTALESVDSLAKVDRARLEAHAVLKRIREELAALMMKAAAETHTAATSVTPSSWADWLKCLTSAEPWRAAVIVAETGAREWSIEAFLNNPKLIQETADLLLSDRAPWGGVALHDALPYVLGFFLSRREDPKLKPIFENLFLVIALDDQISLPQVAGLLTITDARLQLGVSSEEYVAIVRQLSSAIDAVESPSVATVALDAVEVLVSSACPNPGARQDFLTRVSVLFQRWYKRIDLAQWMLLRRFGEELDMPDTFQWGPVEDSATTARSPWQFLQGKRIAMYSLRESALRRAQAIVQELNPNVRVETFHDRVGGSSALRAAAASADIFVIATAAAKHAATMFIEAHRPKANVTVYARGQGSESLLSAIREHVLSL